MKIAITRDIGPDFAQCELSYIEREPIDVPLAQRQHEGYRQALSSLGCQLTSLPALPGHPDGVFVEDVAVVLGEVAILTRPGVASRQGEVESMVQVLAGSRPVARISAPARLEGGDVFVVGRSIFVGLTSRTDAEGVRALRDIVTPHGYQVIAVKVHGCLHLKTACSPLGDGRVLANTSWFDPAPLHNLDLIEVPASEPFAANVLPVGEGVILPAAHPATADVVARHGYQTVPVDNSELLKAESGVTCASLVFEG